MIMWWEYAMKLDQEIFELAQEGFLKDFPDETLCSWNYHIICIQKLADNMFTDTVNLSAILVNTLSKDQEIKVSEMVKKTFQTSI